MSKITADQDARVCRAISAYAQAYATLRTLQTEGLLPNADQMTGAIGEYYVRRHLESLPETKQASYTPHSSKGRDIEVTLTDQTKRLVEVKCVSAYSRTQVLSPIHSGWDHLYLVRVDENFSVDKCWLQDDNTNFKDPGLKIKGRRFPGATEHDFGTSIVLQSQLG